MKRVLGYKSVFLFIIFIYLLVGCSCLNEGFKNITINNELGSYSFEYPAFYRTELEDNLDFQVPYVRLVLEGPLKNEKTEVFDPDTGKIITVVGKRGTSTISVCITNYKIRFGESYSAAGEIEGVLKGEAKWANFKLIERSPVTVSGVEGELVVYLVDKLMPIPVEDGKNLQYVRSVYFDYNDLTWEIIAKCNQEIQDQVKADFDHIIQTFRILD